MAPPLSTAIQEYLAWLEIDRHRSERTVSQYADELSDFSDFVGGDAAVGSIDLVDRELLRRYQRHLGQPGHYVADLMKNAAVAITV
jgi:site-specific recombinase XerD